MITASQRQRLFGMAKQLGLLDKDGEKDLLHTLMSSLTGKDSVKLLTADDYRTVIKELAVRMKTSNLQAPPAPRKQKKPAPQTQQTRNGITEGQRSKVWYLMYELQGCDRQINTATLGERLCGIIRRELKVDCTASKPMQWLSYEQGSKLIEVVKSYCRSAEQRYMRGG